ncbi:MAG: GreA/GreB family elongation factor, partial [Candidatus Sumerlaeia bacterium]|nr:GreA/GreB family elongation factor [Candidatus Sumerlaeia bacterium]
IRDRAVAVIRTAWRYAPDLGNLSETCIQALRALYGDRPHFTTFVKTARLDHRTDLFRALERFEEFLNCDVGEVFEHKTLGIGVVEEIEPDQRRVTIRFPNKAPKEFTFEGVREFLTKHPRGSFRAERARDAEGLRQRLMEQPAEFVRFVLKDFPEGLSQIDLRNLLLDGVLTREQWDSWWAANRRAIQRDPYIDWNRGARGLLRLRSEPKTYYEDVADQFRESDSPAARSALISEIAKHIKDEPPPEGFAEGLLRVLQTEFEALDAGNAAGRLLCIYVAQDLVRVFPALALPTAFDEKQCIAGCSDPVGMLAALGVFEYQCRAVETLAALDRARAVGICAQTIPVAGPRFAQWLLDRLIAEGEIDAVSRALDRLLRSPERYPEMFLWAARAFFDDKFAALTLDVTARDIVLEIADYVRDLQNQVDHGVANAPTLRGIVQKLKNFLAEDRYAVVRLAVTPLSVAEARAVCKAFDGHSAFPDHYVGALRHAVLEVHPDLDEAARAAAADLDESVLYVTRESLARRQHELQHLRTVEIPKNSKEIGEAASLGDLSENAEYEAARHRQRILFKRAEELQKEIERARPMDPSWVLTDRIWPGTRFQVRNLQTGEIETYQIMGAWDSKPEENILSYLTPAAAQFLRKRVGEKITIQRPGAPSTQYEVLKIENALADKAEPAAESSLATEAQN